MTNNAKNPVNATKNALLENPMKEDSNLKDLFDVYYKQVDVVHKFWNYLWLISGAFIVAVNSSNSSADPSSKPRFIAALLFVYLVFAVWNGLLVYKAQKVIAALAKTIRACIQRNTAIQEAIKPPEAREVVGGYFAIVFILVGGIIWYVYFPSH